MWREPRSGAEPALSPTSRLVQGSEPSPSPGPGRILPCTVPVLVPSFASSAKPLCPERGPAGCVPPLLLLP